MTLLDVMEAGFEAVRIACVILRADRYVREISRAFPNEDGRRSIWIAFHMD